MSEQDIYKQDKLFKSEGFYEVQRRADYINKYKNVIFKILDNVINSEDWASNISIFLDSDLEYYFGQDGTEFIYDYLTSEDVDIPNDIDENLEIFLKELHSQYSDVFFKASVYLNSPIELVGVKGVSTKKNIYLQFSRADLKNFDIELTPRFAIQLINVNARLLMHVFGKLDDSEKKKIPFNKIEDISNIFNELKNNQQTGDN